MQYDTLGRLDQHVDPSRGTAETSYNAFGEQVRQTNGAGEETTLSYDDLGRVTQTTSPDGTATNTWDSADNGIGYLASARSADGVVTRYTYDEFGHQETAAWTIDDEVFRLDYGYDEFGRQASLTYPQIPDVPGSAADRLHLQRRWLPAADQEPRRTQAVLAGHGPQRRRCADRGALGNDVVEHLRLRVHDGTADRPRDDWTGGRSAPEAEPALRPQRQPDLEGRRGRGRAEEFGYDRLNRLLTWSVAGEGGQAHQVSYDYDTMGGLVSEKVDGQPERDVTYRYGENGCALPMR